MNPKIHFICIFAFASILYTSVESKPFCLAFRQNSDRISYTFKRFFGDEKTDEIKLFDIIIDGFYWRLEFERSTRSLSFLDANRNGKESPFFSGEYWLATTIKAFHVGWKQGRAVLFRNEYEIWRNLSVGDIPGDTYKEAQDLASYKQNKTLKLRDYRAPIYIFQDPHQTGDGNSSYRLVIVNKWEYNRTIKDMVETDTLQVHLVYVYASDTQMLWSPQTQREQYVNKYKPVHNLKPSSIPYELVGIVPQTGPSKMKGFVLLFIDRNNTQIRWCWAQAEKDIENTDCGQSAKKAHVLIDCSETEVPKKEEKRDYTLIIVVGIILVVIVIVIVCVLFLMIAKRRANRRARFSRRSSQTSSVTSKTSQKSNKEVPKSSVSAAPKATSQTAKPADSTKSPTGAKSPTPPKSPASGAKPAVPPESPTSGAKSPTPPKSQTSGAKPAVPPKSPTSGTKSPTPPKSQTSGVKPAVPPKPPTGSTGAPK